MFKRFLKLSSYGTSSMSWLKKFTLDLCERRTNFHTLGPLFKSEDRRALVSSAPGRDQGTEGENTADYDTIIKRSNMFPSDETPDMLFNGIPFKMVPICNVRVSPNNTILSITEPKTGNVKLIRSCGVEGFKNTRKGTNIAAQATAITFASNALNKGFSTVRVRIRGLGPGRMSAIKGLEMGGLKIISVTDNTPVSWFPPRPRKQKKL